MKEQIEIWTSKKSLEFLIWLRDKFKCIPHSKEGARLARPSNGELRRWIKNGAVLCNGKILTLEDWVQFPISELVFFPNNKHARCTIF